MRQITLNRQLLGLEDLLFGTGTVTQNRANQVVTITEINAGNLPFDETRTLVEFAQDTNLEELGNSVEAINNLNNNLDKLLIVEDNLPIINNVEAIKESIVTLDTNILALQNIYTNMSSINTVEDNLPDVVSVAQNIVPNLTEILNVDTLAAQVTQDKSDVSSMKLAVETIYDTFDDRFLGAKIVDPTLDNDGNALIDGAMYFNTSSNTMKVYDVGTTTWYSIPQIYLSALLDVQLTSITSGNVLRWNGTKWINYTLSKSDVELNLVDNTADSAKNVLSSTKLTTARTINGVAFDGSANITAPTNLDIIAGTTAGPIVTSSSGTNATLPSASTTASGVMTTGAQTFAGAKTFSSSPIVPTPTNDFQAATKKYVDDKTSTEVYQGSYGLEWNETTDTYRRIGAVNYTAIQSLMRRCVLNSDGSVNYYLDKSNSNLKEDGTLAKLDGTDGNVMVEVPKTHVRYTYTTTGGAGTDTVHRWEISLTPDTGFEVHWAFDRGGSIRDKRYYPAYQGYVTGAKMISRSGIYPTTAQTLAQFRTAARANSVGSPSTGHTANGYWGLVDFALYELITMYMIIEYGTMNIQSALGEGRTSLSGGTWVGGELIGVTGLSNSYGNRTTNYTYVGDSTDANADLSFMSYRGCENFFGNVWRMMDGVIFKGTTNNKTMWYSTNPASYNETASGYTNSGIVTATASGYGRKLANTNKGFIVTDVTGGNSNAGTTDYYYTSTTDNTLARVGGHANGGLYAGPLILYVGDAASSFSSVSVGSGVSF